MMLVHAVYLPDPVAVRVKSVRGETVELTTTDGTAAVHLQALLARAVRDGYAVRLELIHYEGQPDMRRQAEARRERKRGWSHEPADTLRQEADLFQEAEETHD